CMPFMFLINSCNSSISTDNTISSDPATIGAGQASFTKYCSGCHNFRQNGIGPQLSEVTRQVSSAWIKNFGPDPQKLIPSGDPRATSLYKQYKTMMPSFEYLKDD